MKRKQILKKLLLALIALVLVAALVVGIVFFMRSNAEPVPVMPFQYVGMTEYWGDNQESSGLVTTDKIQTIFLSETQTITQILVKAGDEVKKGDLLLTFDTTLDGLALEKERLKVEKLKLQLADARTELARINAMRPMVLPPETEPADPEADLGLPLSGKYQVYSELSYDGSTQEKALICWLGEDTRIAEPLLEALLEKARQRQELNAPEPTQSTDPTDATDPTEPAEINSCYVIFKVTQKDMSMGTTLTWQGLEVLFDPDSGLYSFGFFDAGGISDPTQQTPELPEFDFGSGFTAQQIAQMRAQQEKTIKDLDFQVKLAETEYKIKKTEADDGNVYAQLDGTVVSLLTPEEAQANMQPLLKVSGGGGFYIDGSVSELVRQTLQPGQEVTVNDWYTGMVYTGSIVSVNDYPIQSQYYGGGNPNVSWYGFKVFVDGSADLMEGNYASIQFSAASVQSGLFLENPYLRTEGGRSWVMARGEDGKLEKRFVTTGRSLWGSYTEILAGLTAEDLIAFPYGKQAVEGAPTTESDPYGMIMY